MLSVIERIFVTCRQRRRVFQRIDDDEFEWNIFFNCFSITRFHLYDLVSRCIRFVNVVRENGVRFYIFDKWPVVFESIFCIFFE